MEVRDQGKYKKVRRVREEAKVFRESDSFDLEKDSINTTLRSYPTRKG